MTYHIAKGVFDILPKDPDPECAWRSSSFWQYLEKTIHELAIDFGFREIRTPLFETTDLFARSIGNSSDIVTKEMYTFHDRANRSLTLRPEGTAPVLRAFIEKKIYEQHSVNKLFYIFPMFRYERQQAGRYRQHHQFGIEAIGCASPYQDAEGIHLLWVLLKRLGLKNLTLQLNSIGNRETRERFRHHFKEFLAPFYEELSQDSQQRFQVNPLRILDSKNPHDQKVLENAPSILDFLDEASRTHFESLCKILTQIGVPFCLNHKLVRGLDYYNQTVFEITSKELGAQNSLGGGGRYDGLIKELGGPDLPAFGFGAGLERIIQTMLNQKAPFPTANHPLLYLIPLGEAAFSWCFNETSELREKSFAVEMDLSEKKLKHAMKQAHLMNARFVAVIGDNELNTNTLEIKEMATGNVEKLPFASLEMRLKHAKNS